MCYQTTFATSASAAATVSDQFGSTARKFFRDDRVQGPDPALFLPADVQARDAGRRRLIRGVPRIFAIAVLVTLVSTVSAHAASDRARIASLRAIGGWVFSPAFVPS